MAIKTYSVFTNYVFEKTLSLPEENIEALDFERQDIFDSGITTETNYGWITNKEYPLGKHHSALCKIISHHFIQDCDKTLPTKSNEVQVCNPYLLGVLPTYTYDVNIEPMRWYNALMFLQTTNKGSHLILHNMSEKLYASQNTQENKVIIKPKKNKVVYWPSHIPWGLSPNNSMIENNFLLLTFRIAVQKSNILPNK